MKTLLLALLLSGCSGARHYVPAAVESDPCANIDYPHREPYPWEASKVKQMRQQGKCEDLKKYVKTIKEK
jgi:hypothetical protein